MAVRIDQIRIHGESTRRHLLAENLWLRIGSTRRYQIAENLGLRLLLRLLLRLRGTRRIIHFPLRRSKGTNGNRITVRIFGTALAKF